VFIKIVISSTWLLVKKNTLAKNFNQSRVASETRVASVTWVTDLFENYLIAVWLENHLFSKKFLSG
jgi:hypothetical protein